VHAHLCICAHIPRFDLETHVALVIHHRERGKPTATGELALACLANHSLHERGLSDAPVDLRPLASADRRLLVLFPGPDARVLGADLVAEDPRPVTLVVPDGSWRQASKMARRVPGLDAATPVVLPPGPRTRYRLRRERRPEGLATFEAIARALGILEGEHVQRGMEALFELKVARTLWTRQPTGPASDAP
jgi:DTW domain-containing protein YfiP